MKKEILWVIAFVFLALLFCGCQKLDSPSVSGDGDSTAAKQPISTEMRKTASKLLDDIKRLERQGRSMEPLRRNQTIENLKRCGEMMRERQRIADELRNRAESLPQTLSFHLGVAAIESKLCVSCLSTATEKCDRVRTALVEAKKDIDEVAQTDGPGPESPKDSATPSQTTPTEAVKQSEAREVIGKWRDESEPAVMNSTIHIYRQAGKYHLQVRFDKDGSTADEELRKETTRKFRRISHPGDYFVITKNGYLESRDRDGLVFSARPIN